MTKDEYKIGAIAMFKRLESLKTPMALDLSVALIGNQLKRAESNITILDPSSDSDDIKNRFIQAAAISDLLWSVNRNSNQKIIWESANSLAPV